MRTLLALTAVVLVVSAACSGGTAGSTPSASASPSVATAAPSIPTAALSSPTPTPPASSVPGGQAFVSSEYGYSATVPAGAEIAPATSAWDGGDIDHTADYADRFYGTDGVIFVVGAPTDRPLAGFVDDHVAWLTANRGCPAPSSRADAEVGGAPAVRLAFHCPDGIYGATLVDKAMAVRDGRAIIFTSMSPDTGGEQSPALSGLLDSVRWTGP